MTDLPHLVCKALKWKLAAMGKQAPRALSIAGWFCRRPSLVYVVGSVEPGVCHYVREAARGSPVARHGDGQNGSRRATTRDGPAGVETAVRWPRSGGPELLSHGGWSGSPAR